MSQLVRAKITALGAYVPPRLLTNDDLEKLVETSNEWIVERTGIHQRHVVDQGVATSDLATEAARRALAQRGLEPSDLDVIIVATVTPDMFFPSLPAWCSTSSAQRGFGGSISQPPAPLLFTHCRPERNLSPPALTRRSW